MKLSRKDLRFTLLMLFIIALLSAGLYYSYKRRLGSTADEAVGFVRYKYHVVMRKYADRMIWEDVEPETPVYLYDAVLTKDKSDAEIVLKNGLKLDMDPNSLVIIDMIDDQLGIAMQEGSVRAESQQSDAVLVTQDGTVIRLQEATARITSNEQGLQLDVKAGKTKVSRGNEHSEVRQGETLKIDKKSGTQSITKTEIETGTPDDGSLFATDSGQANVTFRWQSQKETSEQNLLIADNVDFKNSRKINVTGKSSHSEKLPPGNYYWQVQARDKDKKPMVSQTASFKVKRETQANALQPPPGANLTQGEPVLFRWQSTDSKAPVIFRLAKDRNFNQPVAEKTVSRDRLLLEQLAPGEYWWRVDSFSGKPGTALSFTITNTSNQAAENQQPSQETVKKDKNIPPSAAEKNKTATITENKKDQKDAEEQRRLLALAEQQKAEQQAKQRELARFRALEPSQESELKSGSTITFSWEKLNLPVRYRYQLSSRNDMEQPVVSRTTEQNSLTMDSPAAGTWYWQVSVLDAKSGQVLKEGDVRSFKVKRVSPPEPPRITQVTVE